MNVDGTEEKEYLPPDYSGESDVPFDKDLSGDDDDDDDFDDEEEDDSAEEEAAIESYLDSQEKFNQKTMNQNNYGGSVPGWGNNQQPWKPAGSTWPNQGGQNYSSSPWGPPATPPQQNVGPWNNNTNNRTPWGNPAPATPSWGNTWGAQPKGPQKEVPRGKRIIFCDVLDCLIETQQSGGRPGLIPRGIYDVRLRFEVWDKIRCFNPVQIYAMIPRSLILSSNGSNSWKVLLEYVSCSLSEYLRIPYQECQILTQQEVGQNKTDMIRAVLLRGAARREESIMIGLDSGGYGQSDRDIRAAGDNGIDYMDLGQLLSSY